MTIEGVGLVGFFSCDASVRWADFLGPTIFFAGRDVVLGLYSMCTLTIDAVLIVSQVPEYHC